MDRADKIVEFMKTSGYLPLKPEELGAVLDVPKEDFEEFEAVIEDLLSQGRIISGKKGRLMAAFSAGLFAGTFSGNERGFGFVRFPEGDDLFIPANAAHGALNGDKVLVSKKRGFDGRMEGRVEKILSRANHHVVGVFQKGRNSGFVIPDDKKISKDIHISKSKSFGAADGQLVVCEIVSYPAGERNPEGEIIEIIGYPSSHDAVIRAVLKRYDIAEEFSEKALFEAEKMAAFEGDYDDRLDLRGNTVITIDGEDSKDLDDAVSLEILDGGIYRLGVHIADVSSFVKHGSTLDKEAYSRGTSVYLADRVVPMLPKILSNGVCSLQPHVDRLTLSCIMDINSQGEIFDYKIAKSVIRSSERMTYRGVTEILEGRSKDFPLLHEMLFNMEKLAMLLRSKRMSEGSLDFDFPEAKIKLDENGVPVSVEKYEITVSNLIIEEFMLAANRTVSEHMYWLGKPMMYRVHESPDDRKLMNFAKVAHNFGYVLKGLNNPHPKAMQAILEQCKGNPEERVLSTLLLRSLMKAKYSPESLGHFGLNAKFYCHFTSPIRRYPDLVVHRLLKEWLKNGISEKREEFWRSYLPDAAEQCSITERNADEAERDVDDIKKAEYMQQFIGESFEGFISGVTNFGFFVELENTVEGLVHITALRDDYYILDEAEMALVGEHTKRTYRLGDKVGVICADANPELRRIDFELL